MNTDKFKATTSYKEKEEADLSTQIELTFYLITFEDDTIHQSLSPLIKQRKYTDAKTFKKQNTVSKEIVTELKTFLKDNGLKVIAKKSNEHKIVCSGKIEQIGQAFDITFSKVETKDKVERLTYSGEVKLPEDLQDYILHIGGLEQGPQKAYRSGLVNQKEEQLTTGTTEVVDKGYTPSQIEDIYCFPENDAEGMTIGVIELGGTFQTSDIEKYCNLFDVPVPTITEVGIKPTVAPSVEQKDDIEVTMDLELIAGLAQKASIVIYYGSSLSDALQTAVFDAKNAPSIISCSWAISEYDCADAELALINSACYKAAQKGITIFAASGDYGAYNQKSFPNVMLPASNPYVVACGGTEIISEPISEIVWNNHQGYASGGGFSALYPVPYFQDSAIQDYKSRFPNQERGAGVPDLSANSAVKSAYSLVVNGVNSAAGAGTSASTPVLASLFARISKSVDQHLGWINPFLYSLSQTESFHEVTVGNNNIYEAAPGWNPATGLGTPNGKQIEMLFQNFIHREDEALEKESAEVE